MLKLLRKDGLALFIVHFFSRFVAKDIGRYLVVLVEGGGNLDRESGYFRGVIRIGIGGRAV